MRAVLPLQSIVLLAALASSVRGQLVPLQEPPAENPQTGAPAGILVTGHVVDGRTRQPIPRALVRFGNRAVLTDHDGIFRLPGVTASSGTLLAIKPGFYADLDLDGNKAHIVQFSPDQEIELPLYPEAIVSGTIVDPLGFGLPDLRVEARRSSFQETGRVWFPSARGETDSAGNFRLPLPPGDYKINVNSSSRMRPGEQAVLPVGYPAASSSDASSIHLGSGEQIHLDLHPAVRTAYRVNVHVEAEDDHAFPFVSAKTSSGAILFLDVTSHAAGEVHFALPSGVYALFATTGNQETRQDARTTVTVGDHDTSGVVLRFAAPPIFPVDMRVDPASTIAEGQQQIPTPQQLGLTFEPTGEAAADPGLRSAGINIRRGPPFAFGLPLGAYRLRAQEGGQWYISSATCGASNLLTEDLLVASATSGAPIQIEISNRTGTLSGTLTAGNAPAPGWVYLVASAPSATPVIILRAAADGTFFRPYLPPGDYRAIAFDRHLEADLRDPDTLARFSARLQSITIARGDQAKLALEVTPVDDLP